jgi:S-adenosylmethionine hydrolase
MKERIIALQTDFGLGEPYVGIMKGKMLSVFPGLRFIDLSHEIDPFNILCASYYLHSSWAFFPEGTIFLSVVDPGVGSRRKVLLAKAHDRFLVTPDNGTLSIMCRLDNTIETFFPEDRLVAGLVENSSSTFQGRDILAPIASIIARDGFRKVRGEKCSPVILPDSYPVLDRSEGKIIGTIMHIDRFGNCITTIHRSDLEKIGGIVHRKITFFGSAVRGLNSTYSDVNVGEQVVYIGSAGFLEIGIREGNASRTTGLGLKDEVLVS